VLLPEAEELVEVEAEVEEFELALMDEAEVCSARDLGVEMSEVSAESVDVCEALE
jgi:hypothetical protein